MNGIDAVDSHELAWLAGLFEGEGSVRISKPALRNWGSLCVDVPNTDRSLVEPFLQFGGSIHYYAEKGRRRGYWRWRAGAKQAALFLMALRPFVRSPLKLEKLDHGVYFQRQKEPNQSSEAYAKRQWDAYWWMGELNVRGARS